VIFRNFWLQRTFQQWTVTKRLEIDQDNLRINFSALNVNFSSPSPNPVSSRRPAHPGVKEGYPLKVVILLLMARVAWKRLQIGTDVLLIITSTGDRIFRFVNIDYLEGPWTPPPPKKRCLVMFSQFLAAAHISTVNFDEMAGDKLGQPA